MIRRRAKRDRDKWGEWLEEQRRPSVHSTQKLRKVESRILDNRTWWKDHGSDVREFVEMFILRLVIMLAGLFILVSLAAVLGTADMICHGPASRMICLR